MPTAQVHSVLNIWAPSLIELDGCPLFAPNDLSGIPKPSNHKQLSKAIGEIKLGDVKWKSF